MGVAWASNLLGRAVVITRKNHRWTGDTGEIVLLYHQGNPHTMEIFWVFVRIDSDIELFGLSELRFDLDSSGNSYTFRIGEDFRNGALC